MSDEHEPERRRMQPGQFITMDAAMLAQQNQRLDELNENIQKLAKSIDQRPTKWDIEQARKRMRNQLVATVVVLVVCLGGLYYNQRRLDAQCLDRNDNATAFRTLLVFLIDRGANNEDAAPTQQALRNYLGTLKVIEC